MGTGHGVSGSGCFPAHGSPAPQQTPLTPPNPGTRTGAEGLQSPAPSRGEEGRTDGGNLPLNAPQSTTLSHPRVRDPGTQWAVASGGATRGSAGLGSSNPARTGPAQRALGAPRQGTQCAKKRRQHLGTRAQQGGQDGLRCHLLTGRIPRKPPRGAGTQSQAPAGAAAGASAPRRGSAGPELRDRNGTSRSRETRPDLHEGLRPEQPPRTGHTDTGTHSHRDTGSWGHRDTQSQGHT